LNVADATLHDEIAVDFANSQIVMGPNAICGLSAKGEGISCVRDDQTQSEALPGESGTPRYVDAEWVYADGDDGGAPAFARFSLLDGHEEPLFDGVYYPEAATSFGDCVYAALMDEQTHESSIWRLSPAHSP
jgi:hypothetical protein